MRRAVITGVGVVSPFGVGVRALWDALAHGRSAVGPIRSFDASTFPTRVAGEVAVGQISSTWMVENVQPWADPTSVQSFRRRATAWEHQGILRDRKVAFGILAAAEAWHGAHCGAAERDAWIAVALGLEQAFLEDFAPIFGEGRIRWEREKEAQLPDVRFRTPVDLCNRLIAETFEIRGLQSAHTSACAAGALSLAHAASLIERDMACIVLAGGADSMVNPLGIGGMSRLGAPSPRSEPDACRPFDRRRDGLAIGEGAAVFVVEDAQRAAARGVKPMATVLGWGSTQDASKATAPLPDGSAAAKAMRRAIERAGIQADAIDYINAHGTGTPLNDPAEIRAIRAALGEAAEHIPISSIKGAVGHLMAAAGSIELAACLLPLREGILPGTAHHVDCDPECDLDIIGEQPRRADTRYILSNSFGFGGQNASVILGAA